MTTPLEPVDPVPVTPTHRRTWKTLWRRCSCGLTAPCVDRRPAPRPAATPPPAAPPALPRPATESSPQKNVGPLSPASPPTGPSQTLRGTRTVGAEPIRAAPAYAAVERPMRASSQPWRPSGGPAPHWPTGSGTVAVASIPARRDLVGLHSPPAAWKKAELRVRTLDTLTGRAGHLTPAQSHRADYAHQPVGHRTRPATDRRGVARDGS